jgi:putative transposase
VEVDLLVFETAPQSLDKDVVNRKRAQRLMRLLGLAAIYQRPNTSKPAAGHKIYPYLPRCR